MYHLAGDDFGYYKAKAAISNAPAQLNPINWEQLQTGILLEYFDLHDVNEPDFLIGQQITVGDYNGWFVEEIIVYGGKYFGNAGGNRPPFNEGVSGAEKHTLTNEEMPSHTHYTMASQAIISLGQHVNIVNSGGTMHEANLIKNAGGGQPHSNIPPTLTVQFWRLVAKV
ncbi:MAG: hypothetical protein LBG94_09840 [Treponema sp.]|jgi:hypothetical protein|nr:hypothetical protein [Treponema sp.]